MAAAARSRSGGPIGDDRPAVGLAAAAAELVHAEQHRLVRVLASRSARIDRPGRARRAARCRSSAPCWPSSPATVSSMLPETSMSDRGGQAVARLDRLAPALSSLIELARDPRAPSPVVGIAVGGSRLRRLDRRPRARSGRGMQPQTLLAAHAAATLDDAVLIGDPARDGGARIERAFHEAHEGVAGVLAGEVQPADALAATSVPAP